MITKYKVHPDEVIKQILEVCENSDYYLDSATKIVLSSEPVVQGMTFSKYTYTGIEFN